MFLPSGHQVASPTAHSTSGASVMVYAVEQHPARISRRTAFEIHGLGHPRNRAVEGAGPKKGRTADGVCDLAKSQHASLHLDSRGGRVGVGAFTLAR